jgi:four helix bundle protein
MNEFTTALRTRLRRFAVDVVRFVRGMPEADTATTVIVRQLVKSGTAESANYRAACRGRSRAEFIAKLGVALEEADETEHWLDIILEVPLAAGAEPERLRREAAELRAILKTSFDTARRNSKT